MTIDIENYYKKYGPMVLRRCRFLLKDEDKALDAMQDVFVKLLSRKDRLQDKHPSSLLYRIATNICLNIIRSEKSRPGIENEDLLLTIASYDDNIENAGIQDFLNRLFKNEKTSTEEIAVMHYIDKMTLEETAFRSGLSVSGVRKRLRKLREKALIMEEKDNE